MPQADILFQDAKLADGTRSAIIVKDGKIQAMGRGAEAGWSAPEVVDLAGSLVIPGFVEGHIHLDTSFCGDAWKPHKPCTAGFDVRERVEFQRQNMAAAAPMDVRARNQLGVTRRPLF